MKVRDSLFFSLYKIFGQSNFINSSVRQFYLYVLTPTLTYFIKRKHQEIIEIIPRHSILDPVNFNAFLSDIDLTIVIKNNYDPSPLINSFITIKKIFLMFDMPEFYTQDEFLRLNHIKNHPLWNIINTFWNIRKINWNLKSLQQNPSQLNKVKKNKSNIKSFKIITGCSNFKKNLYLSDLIYLKEFSTIPSLEGLCFYSSFLETNTEFGLKIILAPKEFYDFNYLMPDQNWIGGHDELKTLIKEYEFLITTASIRIDEVKKLDTKLKRDWLRHLAVEVERKSKTIDIASTQ